jgi:hypothetical protein
MSTIPSAGSLPVTTAERAAYWRFVQRLVPPFTETVPETLWHYTTGDSLIKIITSGKLWATQVSCVNDRTEVRYAARLYKEALEAIATTQTLTPDEQNLYQHIVNVFSEETNASGWFISCFSQVEDDLSQWRAYGGNGEGFAIGFDMGQLHCLSAHDDCHLVKVNYDPAVHRNIVSDVAKATFGFYTKGLSVTGRNPKDWTEDFLSAWGDIIPYLAPIMKVEAFKDEKEWRIVRLLRSPDAAAMIYTQRKTLLARHLPIRFRPFVGEDDHLPIKTICVGPSQNSSVSRISVGDLLRTKRYFNPEPAVLTSRIPYQSV